MSTHLHIFSFLSNLETIQSCKLVNKEWNNIVCSIPFSLLCSVRYLSSYRLTSDNCNKCVLKITDDIVMRDGIFHNLTAPLKDNFVKKIDFFCILEVGLEFNFF